MEELYSIFQNVNDWLKFAEAKHSGLIAISSALLLAIPTLLKQPKNKWNRLLYILPSISFAIAVVKSCISPSYLNGVVSTTPGIKNVGESTLGSDEASTGLV